MFKVQHEVKMNKIKVKETTMVKPAEKTPRRSLWMSGLDLMNTDVHNRIIYFYKHNGASNFFDPSVLKEALSKVLVHFYPMAGRFSHDGDGRLEINCNEEGVLFVVAESSSVLNDFGDFAPSPEMQSLIPVVDYSGGISSYPFFVSQVTYFKCGGVSLGAALEHRVVDGPSAFDFVNAWSDIARGLDLKVSPFFDRTILRPRNPPQILFNHIEYQLTPEASQSEATNKISQDGAPTTYKVAVFQMTKEQVNILKAKIREYGNTINYSTYEILAGHIWKCASKARDLPNNQEVRLHFPVNGRSNFRLQPPPPPRYFGSVVFAATATAVATDLQSKPLWYAVSRVHETLTRMNNDYLRSAIDYLELYPRTKRYGTHFYRSPNFRNTSWMNLRVYDADFGWGRPFFMGPGGNMCEGKSCIIPSATSDRSLTVIIGLQAEQMEVFEKLFYEYDKTKHVRANL